MKKTGLLFGSFNPIHIGHLMIAGYMYEFSDLDELWFVVSPLNPLKEKQSLLADHHRLEMVNLAIDDDTRFRSCNIEFKLPKPSFTIHTLTYLQDKYPDREFVIISGTDIFPTFYKWKNWEQLLEFYKFYVYPRTTQKSGICCRSACKKKLRGSYHVHHIRHVAHYGVDIGFATDDAV